MTANIGKYESYNFYNLKVVLFNILIAFSLLFATRIVFLLLNIEYFPAFEKNNYWLILCGALKYDLAGTIYCNLFYLILCFLPLSINIKQSAVYQVITKLIFIIFNSLCILANLADTVYFRFTQRRTTASFFREFSNDNNLAIIIRKEIIHHWFLIVLFTLIVFILFISYRSVKSSLSNHKSTKRYWFGSVFLFIGVGLSALIGIRGEINPRIPPITLSTANQYVNRPIESAVILNTPYSIIRSMTGKTMPSYAYFKNPSEAEHIFPAIHLPKTDSVFKKMNVVIIIMESFGKEYVGAMNNHIIGENYKGYTPFLDSLISKGLVFETSIANGHKSIDALPAVLSSIPCIVESYMTSNYASNSINSLAADLKLKGYYSAFFHGAPNGSMGMWAFAKSAGFQNYFGKTEYGNDADYDGTWAIWDEPFFQYFAHKMNTFREPFITTIFSATSHHPFVIPDKYKNKFKGGRLPIHKCIEYSDYSLRRFFNTASKMQWYGNTLFVITGDHANQSCERTYQNNIGRKSVAMLYFCRKMIKPEKRNEITQQIDIRPSVLGLLNYDLPYIGFGRDVFHSKPEDAFGVYESGYSYEFLTNQYILQFDGHKATGLFDYKNDSDFSENLFLKRTDQSQHMELKLKSLLNNYEYRMKNNKMVIR